MNVGNLDRLLRTVGPGRPAEFTRGGTVHPPVRARTSVHEAFVLRVGIREEWSAVDRVGRMSPKEASGLQVEGREIRGQSAI
jgi:hypothetical protein